MNILKSLFLGASLLFVLPLSSQTANTGATHNPAQQPAQPPDAHADKKRDGDELFTENCSRCHNAPESFSPRVSGTIVRHMRVRAGLSKEDAQAILRFLNP
jgi:mono/diheme cytochrome c family protein